MHTMYYTHEVRKVEEFRTDTTLASDKEMQLASMLIESLAAAFEPDKYTDSYRNNIQTLIDAKVAGRQVVAPPEPTTAKVIDIMEALKQSLEAAKRKPAALASHAAEEPGAVEMAAQPPAKKPRRKAAG